MDDYQTIEQRGVQELVAVRWDEDGVPCIYLRDIDAIFPNTSTISSYGARIYFTTNASGVPKIPLRIPFFENRVLEIFSDNSVLEWSREATASRLAAAAASATASITPMNTVHTRPLPGVLDLPPFIAEASDLNENEESDISFDMAESAGPSDEDDDDDDNNAATGTTIANTSTTTAPIAISSRPLATVQSFERLRLGPPQFENRARDSVVSSTMASSLSSSHHQSAIPEEAEDDTAPPPPTYEPIDTGTLQQLTGAGSIVEVPHVPLVMDDLAERHLVHDRVGIIKRITGAILAQEYEAESCPHPPLFILLPENPSKWSVGNILHNKMRLHFLCDFCEHEIFTYDQQETRAVTSKRNIHVDQTKGFELRLDQYPDQMLLIKFGQYILNLLRMLQYGVSLDDVFVGAAFDRPVPLMSTSGTNVGGKSGIDPQLFFRLKENVERAIAFMEALLGDEYEEDDATEAIKKLDLNDFRLLDAIVKRPSYTQADPSISNLSTLEEAAHDVHRGGSGLYRVPLKNNRVRWGCDKYYNLNFERLDKVFGSKLQLLQMSFESHTRSSSFVAMSENQLNSRIIAVSKIRSLFKIDFTIAWDFATTEMTMLSDLMKRDIMSASTLSIRLSKNVAPLSWQKNLTTATNGSEDDQQPIRAVLNLVKTCKIKHLALEGDIDIFSIPNLGAMDLSNLDILSIMKTNSRSYNKTPVDTRGGQDMDGQQPRNPKQDLYIPQLISALPAFNFLREVALGFPDTIPGHIRILQACLTGLSRLQRLDLFRISGFSSSGTGINRKLELSASVASSKLTRLYLGECRAVGDARIRLLESLEELLTDEGADLEDLELRFIGFNDKHAHALEFGTRPVGTRNCCRLRRLVIHGKGLEHAGVSAMKRVLRRATRSPQHDRETAFGSGDGTFSTIATAAPVVPVDPNSLFFGSLLEKPTLTHLELCSIDSVSDDDWASLLSELQLARLITLDVQGVWLGDRAIASLAKGTADSTGGLSSPLQSPTSDTFSTTSSPPSSPALAPPAFFSSSAPLQLQTLRLSCSSLSNKGVGHLQELLSRLIHLSTLSLHGFRKVTAEDWMDILARVSFRWIEVIEIVSLGFDDACVQYLSDRIHAREQMLEQTTTATGNNEPTLPGYSARPVTTTTATESSATPLSATTVVSSRTSTSSSSSSSSSSLSLPSPTSTRSSFSSLIRSGTNRGNRDDSNNKKAESKTPAVAPLPTVPKPVPKPVPFQKYLELDLRYTDVSSKGLSALKNRMAGQAKKVVIRMRDGEEEFDLGDTPRSSSSTSALSTKSSKLDSEKNVPPTGGTSGGSSYGGGSSSGSGGGRRMSGVGFVSTSSLTMSSIATSSSSHMVAPKSPSAAAFSSSSTPLQQLPQGATSSGSTSSNGSTIRRLKSAFSINPKK